MRVWGRARVGGRRCESARGGARAGVSVSARASACAGGCAGGRARARVSVRGARRGRRIRLSGTRTLWGWGGRVRAPPRDCGGRRLPRRWVGISRAAHARRRNPAPLPPPHWTTTTTLLPGRTPRRPAAVDAGPRGAMAARAQVRAAGCAPHGQISRETHRPAHRRGDGGVGGAVRASGRSRAVYRCM